MNDEEYAAVADHEQPSPVAEAVARILALPAAGAGSDGERHAGWAALRAGFQRHLLGWLRDADPRALPRLVHVAEASAAALRDPALDAVWRLAAGAIECMAGDEGAAATESKRLLATLEGELRRLDRDGEGGAREALSADLVAVVARRVAAGEGRSARVDRLRREFGFSDGPAVADVPPGASEPQAEARSDSGVDSGVGDPGAGPRDEDSPSPSRRGGGEGESDDDALEVVLSEAEISDALSLDFEGQDPFAGAYDDALAATANAIAQWRAEGEGSDGGLDAVVGGFRASAAGARLAGAPNLARAAEAVAERLARDPGAPKAPALAFAREALDELAAVSESTAPPVEVVHGWWQDAAPGASRGGDDDASAPATADGGGAEPAPSPQGPLSAPAADPVEPAPGEDADPVETPQEAPPRSDPGGAGRAATRRDLAGDFEQLDDDIEHLDLQQPLTWSPPAADPGREPRGFLPPAAEREVDDYSDDDADDGLSLLLFDNPPGDGVASRPAARPQPQTGPPGRVRWGAPAGDGGVDEELEVDGFVHASPAEPAPAAAEAEDAQTVASALPAGADGSLSGAAASPAPQPPDPLDHSNDDAPANDVQDDAPAGDRFPPAAARYDVAVEDLPLDELPVEDYPEAGATPQTAEGEPADGESLTVEPAPAPGSGDGGRTVEAPRERGLAPVPVATDVAARSAGTAPGPVPDGGGLVARIDRVRGLLDTIASGSATSALRLKAVAELRALSDAIGAEGVAERAGAADGPAVSPSLAVLVVTATLGTRRSIAAVLDGAGYRTFGARDGADALAMLARVRPDVVVCDVSLPRMGGLEFLEHARSRLRRRLPAVVRGDEQEIAQAGEGDGAAGVTVVDRNAAGEELLNAVRVALARSGTS